MSSRRLLNRSRPPAAAAASSSSSTTTTTKALPDYEPSSCPLNDAARRALGDLSNNRGTSAYESQLKDSLRYLGTSVGDLHERLRARHDRLDALRERREHKGTAKTQEEERLEAHILDLGAKVDEMSRSSESAVRDVIDQRAELEDEASVLGDLYTTAATASHNVPRDGPAADDAGDAADEPTASQLPAGPSTLTTLTSLRSSKKAAYNDLTPHQRYGLNNDYAGFKKLWHDAAAGEDGPPLPDASRWFRRDGQPVLSRVAGAAPGAGDDDAVAAGEEDGSDDDVAVAREVLSIKCPLTLRPMEEPFSNGKCKHTFDKVAILDHLRARGVVPCPQTGCSQTFSRDKFEQDFYLDQAMLRRIQRAKQAEQSRDDMDVDEDDVGGADENDSVVFGTQRRVPGRPAPKKEE